MTSPPQTEIPPGWYPDPRDTNNQRFFDGESWTEQVTPRQDMPGPAPRGRRPSGKVWLIAGSVIVIVLLVVAVALRVQDRDPVPTEFETVQAGMPEDPDATTADVEIVEGGEVAPGESIEGSIETGQEWHGTLVIEEAVLIVIDTRAADDSDVDLTMALYDQDDEQVAGNDDRGSFGALGGAALDPIIIFGSRAGEFSLVVGSWLHEGAGSFTVEVVVPEEIDIDTTEELTFGPDDDAMARTIVAPEPLTLSVEASSDDGVLLLVGDTSVPELFEHHAEGPEPIAEEFDLSEGQHLLVVSRAEQSEGELSLTLSSE